MNVSEISQKLTFVGAKVGLFVGCLVGCFEGDVAVCSGASFVELVGSLDGESDGFVVGA